MDSSKSHLALLRGAPIPRKPKPPSYLSAQSKRWFASVVTNWIMEDTDLRLLTLAAENFDIAESARKTLLAEGRFYIDPKGVQRAHPLVKVQKDAMTLAVRIVRDLKLDVVPPRVTGRPPGGSGGMSGR
jgi:phage terminase small subunit